MNATQLANKISDEVFAAHRGVARCCNVWVAFGNDGYAQDERTRTEVRSFTEWLAAKGYKFGPLALNDDGYTWIIVIAQPADNNLERVEMAMWNAHKMAHGTASPVDATFIDVQQREALKATEDCRLDDGCNVSPTLAHRLS